MADREEERGGADDDGPMRGWCCSLTSSPPSPPPMRCPAMLGRGVAQESTGLSAIRLKEIEIWKNSEEEVGIQVVATVVLVVSFAHHLESSNVIPVMYRPSFRSAVGARRLGLSVRAIIRPTATFEFNLCIHK